MEDAARDLQDAELIVRQMGVVCLAAYFTGRIFTMSNENNLSFPQTRPD